MSEANELILLSELRIGNILQYEGKYVQISFLSLDIDDEYTDQIGFVKLGETSNEISGWNKSLFKKLSRVQITPDILQKAGGKRKFVLHSTEEFWIIGDFALSQTEIDKMGSLHFLQNWYYFRSFGEELNVNL